jgi:hypothetical protein
MRCIAVVERIKMGVLQWAYNWSKQAPFRALGVMPQAAGILGGFLAGRSRLLACVL